MEKSKRQKSIEIMRADSLIKSCEYVINHSDEMVKDVEIDKGIRIVIDIYPGLQDPSVSCEKNIHIDAY